MSVMNAKTLEEFNKAYDARVTRAKASGAAHALSDAKGLSLDELRNLWLSAIQAGRLVRQMKHAPGTNFEGQYWDSYAAMVREMMKGIRGY